MNWFLLALIPPALWSITNHLDKYLISTYIKTQGVGALMIFSSLIGLFIAPIILITNPQVLNIEIFQALLIALNGMLYVLAVLPYFHALQKDEASIVVPLFQLIPVISFIISYFLLNETLTIKQILGGALIVIGAISISLEIQTSQKPKFKSQVFLLMLLSSILFSINFTLFKFFSINSDFWTTSFWEYIGFTLFAVILIIFVKPYRQEFINLINQNKLPILGLNGFNEVINIFAKIAFNFASILTPVTMVWVVNGFQPLFVFIYGVLITIFFPKISKESLLTQHLIQKLVSILIMVLGGFIVNN